MLCNFVLLRCHLFVEEIANKTKFDQILSGFSNQTPSLLRLKKVPKRFATRVRDGKGNIDIMFGSGISSHADEIITPNPDNVGAGLMNGLTRLNYAFDNSDEENLIIDFSAHLFFRFYK